LAVGIVVDPSVFLYDVEELIGCVPRHPIRTETAILVAEIR
jgi:hypothetical protein